MQRITTQLTIFFGLFFIVYEYALRVSDSVIVNHLMVDLHLNPAQVGVLSSAYYIPYVLMQMPAGALLDRYGVYKCWMLAISVVAMGSFLFAYSDGLLTTVVARAFMGIGSAFAWVGVVKLITQYMGVRKPTLMIGISMSVAMLGAVLGQAPWLYLTNWIGHWRFPYFFGALWGLLLVSGLAVLCHFHRQISYAANSVVSWKKIRKTFKTLSLSGNFWVLALFAGMLATPQSAFTAIWGVKFLTDARGIPATLAATLVSTVWIGAIFGGPTLGLIADRVKNKYFLAAAVGISLMLLMSLVTFVTLPSHALLMLVFFVIGGLSNGNIIIFVLMCQRFKTLPTASVVGITNMVNMGVGPIFQLVIGLILTTPGMANVVINAGRFEMAIAIIPIVLTLSSLVVFLLAVHEGRRVPGVVE